MNMFDSDTLFYQNENQHGKGNINAVVYMD